TQPADKYLTFNRAGGNRITAYNWETNASNAGSDYFNQNDNFLSSSTVPGAAFTGQIQAMLDAGAQYLMSIPMIGYVSADENGDGDVNKTPNYINVRFNKSFARKGSAFTASPDLTDKAVYQDEFVNFLKVSFPTAFTGSQAKISFMLDNEPDLWASTHARLRGDATGQSGQGVTYAELFQKTEDYASAIKAVAPNALVFGPASYGWQGFVNLQGASDAAGRDFITAYLAEMKAYETANGKRILDVLDLHWYPEAQSSTNVRITGDDSTAPVQAARVQAPRSLYDSTYVEKSWITQYSTGGAGINLIPRMMGKINSTYAGTKLSFSEYDYGGGNDISGGVAEADVLGIFGAQGVFAANLWPLQTSMPFTSAGMAMYRNFDGKGGAFGDTSINATTTDGTNTAIYASVDAANPNRMVLVVVNRGSTSTTSALRIWHTVTFTSAHLYQLAGSTPAPQDKGTVSVNGNALSLTLPGYSVTTVLLAP
ncbi:MAG: glycoside hydrolase family 44 protein, partial [Asticcacaulis sp.]